MNTSPRAIVGNSSQSDPTQQSAKPTALARKTLPNPNPPRRTILGTYLGNGSQPAPVQLSVKPFPWPPFTLDLAATAAASAFNLLIVFAFLNPVRSVVVTIVREKELRLREGMRILGLTVRAGHCRCVFFPCE